MPWSHQFCGSCNRIRMTAEGRLKLCLHYQDGIELRPLLREGRTDDEIREAIVEAVRQKPRAHDSHTRQSIQMQIREEWFKLGGSVKKPKYGSFFTRQICACSTKFAGYRKAGV